MTTPKDKYENISIVLKTKPPAPASIHRLPDVEGLTENEMNRKSTSDRRKRRIAHVPKYPPVIKKPVIPVPAEPIKKHCPKKPIMPEPERILTNSELESYMKKPIKVRKIRVVDVPWAYSAPTTSVIPSTPSELVDLGFQSFVSNRSRKSSSTDVVKRKAEESEVANTKKQKISGSTGVIKRKAETREVANRKKLQKISGKDFIM